MCVTNLSVFNLELAPMEHTFWDNRYAENEWVYGTAPNQYFKQFIDSKKPGKLLLPAEGEGRNAVYAAKKGWEVDAFDFSPIAQQKALQLAKEQGVTINYWIQKAEEFEADKKYDAVGLIYVHLPQGIRSSFHKEVYNSLNTGGFLLFEAFAKEQIQLASGGPKDPSLLYDAPTICNDFPFLHLLSCGQKEIELDEGKFHKGKAAVLRMKGQRL